MLSCFQCALLYFVSYSCYLVNSYNLDVNAEIDFGKNWNYKYNFRSDPLKDIYKETERKYNKHMRAAKYKPKEENYNSGIYVKPVKVKDDQELKTYLQHTYRQSLDFLREISTKIKHEEVKIIFDDLVKSYGKKFNEFVTDNKDILVKSRLGKQKVMINTMETSNRLLDRIFNYLHSKIDLDKPHSRSRNFFENELQRKTDFENEKLCKKFDICYSAKGFSTFLSNLLTIIIKTDNDKLKSITNAIIKVIKTRDFSNIINDKHTRESVVKNADLADALPIDVLRSVYTILKNIIDNRNSPLKVSNVKGTAVDKTLALIEIVNLYDSKLPVNEANILDWNDIINSLFDYTEAKRNDITEIIHSIADQFDKVCKNLSKEEVEFVNKNIKIINKI